MEPFKDSCLAGRQDEDFQVVEKAWQHICGIHGPGDNR